MFLFQFGWARPVPVEPRYYKNPKKGMALCGLAGPAVNLMMGIHSYSVYCMFVWFASHNEVFVLIPLIGSMPDQMFIFVAQTMGLIGYYNILLAIFNLLPIPPFDGSRLMYAFLPDRYYFGVMKHERTIMFVVLALLWIGVLDILFDAVFTAVSFVVESAVIGGLDVILSLLSGV
ncbi:MAG: site-2 protease family protein [Clostridia bacterium]|nr:site-2 protease family protein [Clostridia bacterium]